MDARDQLLRLVRIQDLANAIREAEGVVEAAPARIAESENRLRERNSEYVAMKSRFDALEADRKARSFELETLEDARKKYMDSLMAVKNQREYAAALKIDSVKAKIGGVDIAIRTHLPLLGEQDAEPLSRNHINILISHVIVALPGGPGTLSEVQHAVRYGRPLITWLDRRDEIPGLPDDVLVEADFEKIRAFVRRHISRPEV